MLEEKRKSQREDCKKENTQGNDAGLSTTGGVQFQSFRCAIVKGMQDCPYSLPATTTKTGLKASLRQ